MGLFCSTTVAMQTILNFSFLHAFSQTHPSLAWTFSLTWNPLDFRSGCPSRKKERTLSRLVIFQTFCQKKQVNIPGFLSTSEPMARRPPQVLPPPQRRGVPASDRRRDGSHTGRIVRVLPGGHDGLGPVKNTAKRETLAFFRQMKGFDKFPVGPLSRSSVTTATLDATPTSGTSLRNCCELLKQKNTFPHKERKKYTHFKICQNQC